MNLLGEWRMATNKEVIEDFVKGEHKGKSGSIFIEDNVIYSYGTHFPMAIRLWDGYSFKFIINSDSYSRTTSRHQSMLIRAIGEDNVLKRIITPLMSNYKGFHDVKEIVADSL